MKRLIVVAGVILAVYALLSWLGLRNDVAVLSGAGLDPARAILGLSYAAAWFGAVVLLPILLLAAAIMALWAKVARGVRGSRGV